MPFCVVFPPSGHWPKCKATWRESSWNSHLASVALPIKENRALFMATFILLCYQSDSEKNLALFFLFFFNQWLFVFLKKWWGECLVMHVKFISKFPQQLKRSLSCDLNLALGIHNRCPDRAAKADMQSPRHWGKNDICLILIPGAARGQIWGLIKNLLLLSAKSVFFSDAQFNNSYDSDGHLSKKRTVQVDEALLRTLRENTH